MRNGKIIVVDDHEAVLKTLRLILGRTFKTVLGTAVPTLLPALLREGDVDVVLLDMNFGTGKQDGTEGLFWLDRICECPNRPEVILITAFADIELAVAALKRGAANFIVKPWDNEKLLATILEAFERRSERLSASLGMKPEYPSDENEQEKDLSANSSHPPTLEEMEKQFIREVLNEKRGNLTLCAQQLNISRQTLYNKMRKYQL